MGVGAHGGVEKWEAAFWVDRERWLGYNRNMRRDFWYGRLDFLEYNCLKHDFEIGSCIACGTDDGCTNVVCCTMPSDQNPAAM